MANPKDKTVDVVRHSEDTRPFNSENGIWRIDPPSPLSREGNQIAMLVSLAHVDGNPYAWWGCSPILRAVQTAQILVPKQDWSKHHIQELGPKDSTHVEQWESLFDDRRFKKAIDDEISESELYALIHELRTGLLEREAYMLAGVVREALGEIQGGQHAMLVTHQPQLVFVDNFFRTGGEIVLPTEPLQVPVCTIKRLTFSDGNQYVGCETLLPPPM